MDTERDLSLREKDIIPEEILELGGQGNQVRLRPEVSIGRNLAYIVISIIAATIVFLGILLVRSLPPPPVLNSPDAVATIERYKELSQAVTDNVAKLFDLVVTKGLLPVFTLIVGYVIGSHARSRASPDA